MSKKKRAKMNRTRTREKIVRNSKETAAIKLQRAINTLTEKNNRIAKAIERLSETKKKGEERLIELGILLDQEKENPVAETAA